eukprot:15469181-Alexandrium_andersonii.AAC.1
MEQVDPDRMQTIEEDAASQRTDELHSQDYEVSPCSTSNDDSANLLGFLSEGDLCRLYAVSRWRCVVVGAVVTGEGLEAPDDLGASQRRPGSVVVCARVCAAPPCHARVIFF